MFIILESEETIIDNYVQQGASQEKQHISRSQILFNTSPLSLS